MDALIADFVRETTATTGTGEDVTLVADTGYARFSDAYAVNDVTYYIIRDGNNAELGIGTVKTGNVLGRTTPLVTLVSGTYNSSSPSRINLSGNAIVAVGPSAKALLDAANDGASVDAVNVWNNGQRSAMPPLTVDTAMDMNGPNSRTLTLTGSNTLPNPSNLAAGQSGVIYVTKTNAGDSLAYGTYWPTDLGDFSGMSTSQTGAIYYSVISSTSIDASTKYPVGT